MEKEQIQARLLTVKETAKYLAICERTVWFMIKEQKIPAIRFGRIIRFDKRDLDEFIDRCKNGRFSGQE